MPSKNVEARILAIPTSLVPARLPLSWERPSHLFLGGLLPYDVGVGTASARAGNNTSTPPETYARAV